VSSQGSKRVLLVDDNQDAAELMNEFLTLLGHEVVVAYDGPTALALAGAFAPQVALLDIGLPVMDGYELVRSLRRILGGGACRYFALTGYGQPDDAARAVAAGFERVLVKPVDHDLLEHLLTDERTV